MNKILSKPAFIFTLLVGLTGCITDHNIEPVFATMITLPYEYKNQAFDFKIQVDDLGNQSIIEYGIVYTAYFRGQGNHNMLPTIADSKIVFNSPITSGVNQYSYYQDFINGKAFIKAPMRLSS